MKIIGGALALLMAAASSSWAGLPDEGWTTSFPAPVPIVRAQFPATPGIAAAPAVPAVVFKGLSIKSIQFSRSDRIPVSLVAAIDRTEKTLLLAVYGLKLSEVAAAILRAKARGVAVSLIYNEGHTKPAVPSVGSGPSEEYLALVAAGVPTRLLGGGSFGIMHHKYAVFDGELLMTGSFNWTRPADEKNFENAVFKTDPALIAGFTKNWKWMWSLGRPPTEPKGEEVSLPLAVGGGPPVDPVKPVAFGGGKYPRYAFSPKGGVEDLLVDAISRSKKTIDVAIFSFYAQRVVDALIAAKARGVVVRVAADTMQARRSQPMLALSNSGVGLRLSSGREGVGAMHHKYALFDGAMLMSGSYNFSTNAEQFNFENDLFTVAPAEAAAFGGEFAVIWAQAHAPEPGELPAPKSL